jgi:signal transduction histidine kinase
MKNLGRDLIIGKNNYIESWCEFKQVMLSGQYILISMILGFFYMMLDLAHGTYETLPVLLLAETLFFAALYLHRKGNHCSANYFLFPTLTITIYLFSASESPNTGLFILFLPIVLGAFAVFDYRMRLISIFISCGVYALFSLAYFTDFSVLPVRNYSEEEILVNIIVNFSVALPASVLAIYLMIRMNHYNALQLVESNKLLKKTNEELDRFVYSTSHDLRAPLSSVLGLVNLAQTNSNNSETQQYLGMMKERVHALEFFIKEITDFSRNNRVRVYREEVNLAEMANSIWETLRYASEAQGIEFKLDFPTDLVVNTDKTRLQVVLSNLISNAIRYHDASKAIRYICVKHHVTPQSFCITVEDNGQGIDPEYQKKVFDMFYRANESSQGSGLGLYIVKETLAKLSGSIQLESVPNTGSAFHVILPQRIRL